MACYRIKVSYRGTLYRGWQIQRQGKTIQGEILRAFFEICKTREVKILAAGRTDARVHALEQVFRADIPKGMSPLSLHNALNSHLDISIRILSVSECSHEFHPICDARWKEYLYYFSWEEKNPFDTDLVVHLKSPLDEEKMREGASLFIGTHDFHNYHCKGSDPTSTIRTIFECDLTKDVMKLPFPVNCHVCRIRGDGFLKQMVRLIVGTLWELGKGRITLEEVKRSLEFPMEKKTAPVAPPEGLYLSEVCYEPGF